MANRRLYWNIQQVSRQNILTNFNKSTNQWMPAISENRPTQIRNLNVSFTNHLSELSKIPRINLEKPTRPYQPRRALM